jgi:hypothetical protein
VWQQALDVNSRITVSELRHPDLWHLPLGSPRV